MGKWLNGCEICNIGLVSEVNRLKSAGLSELAACRQLAKTAEKKFGAPMWTEEVIRMRYRYHLGIDKKERVVENLQQPTEKPSQTSTLQAPPEKKPTPEPAAPPAPTPKPRIQQPSVPEVVVVEPEELGASYHIEVQKAIVKANEPQPTELEKAEKIIVKAAKMLSDIVEGNLRDTGTDDDRLAAESIKRHGPGIIISFIQLGIDVHKVYDFYAGENNGHKLDDQRSLRITGNVEADRH
jgi:hypothetical protein